MSSALRLLADGDASPTPVLELPIYAPYTGMGNRRFMPRAQAGFSVQLDGEPLAGVDISFGGCMCVATTPVWPGNSVDVTLRLEGEDDPIICKGEVLELVQHEDDVAMRIRFDALSNARRKQIAMWMARRASELR